MIVESHMRSIIESITKKIKHEGHDWVFTSQDFLDIGTRTMVAQALSRLVKQGMIRRLDRGIYDYPKYSKLLGALTSATADNIARALASGDRIFPSGAVGANLLGFSTQVPAKSFYLTNATTRTRHIGGYTIKLERARVPLLDNVPDHINLVIQALHYLGKHNIDDIIIKRCARILRDCDLADLRCAAEVMPRWMVDTIHKIEREKFKR